MPRLEGRGITRAGYVTQSVERQLGKERYEGQSGQNALAAGAGRAGGAYSAPQTP